jgi:hypothetical protein
MASASSVRGQLLREVTALSDQILETQTQFTTADAKLRAQQESVELVQAQIKQAEVDLASLEAQRKFESENDLELLSLQRAVSGLTQRKHDLIRLTKAARIERDKLKEEARAQYYTRMGLLMEAQSIALLVERSEREADVVRRAILPPMTSDSNWTTESVALFADYDGLWKKISAHEETVRDLVDATLSLHNLAIPPIVSPPVAAAPSMKAMQRAGSAGVEYMDAPSGSASGTLLIPSTATARAAQSMYATFGAEFIASEAQKAVGAIRGFQTSLSGLTARVGSELSRTAAIHTSLHAGPPYG